jgi:hypothetical protein
MTAANEISCIVILVPAHGTSRSRIGLDHVVPARALGRAIGLRQPSIDNKPIAVLHHQMPHVTELGLLARTLAEQPGNGIGGRGMCVIPTFLAIEVALGRPSARSFSCSPKL